MDKMPTNASEFSCLVDLPILIGVERRRVPVIAVFRGLPKPDLEEWVMPGGVPRSDHELATEILSELRCAGGNNGRSWPRSFCIATVLDLDSASALLVATFLSESARSAGVVPLASPASWSHAASAYPPRRTSELARRRDGRGAACHSLQ